MAATIEEKSLGDLLEELANDPDEGPLLHVLVLTYEFDQEQLFNLLLRRELPDMSPLSRRDSLHISRIHPLVIYDAAKTRDFSALPPLLELHPWKSRAFGCHHSKAYCLVTEGAVHLFLGSFNLTFSGLFRNREVMEHLCWKEGGDRESGLLIREWTDFLRLYYGSRVHASGASALNDLLACLDERLAGLAKNAGAHNAHLLFSGYGGKNGINRLQEIWKTWYGDTSPDTLYVVSPFFDGRPEKGCAAASFLNVFPRLRDLHVCTDEGGFSTLSRAHCSGMKAHVRLIEAAPEAERAAIEQRAEDCGVRVPEGYVPERRLHAKILLLSGGGHGLCCLGSANFTNNAWLGRNQELGLVFRTEGDAAKLWKNITRGLYAGSGEESARLPDHPPTHPAADPEDEITKEEFPDFVAFITLEPRPGTGEALFHLHIEKKYRDTWQELLRAYTVRWGEKGAVLTFNTEGNSAPMPEEEWQKRLVGGRTLEFLHNASGQSFPFPFLYAGAFMEGKEALLGISDTEWLLLHQNRDEDYDDAWPGPFRAQEKEGAPSAPCSVDRRENVIIAMQNYLNLFGGMESLFQKRLAEASEAGRPAERLRAYVVGPLREFAGLLRREAACRDSTSGLFKLGELLLFVQRLSRSPETSRLVKRSLQPLAEELQQALDACAPKSAPETVNAYLAFIRGTFHGRNE